MMTVNSYSVAKMNPYAATIRGNLDKVLKDHDEAASSVARKAGMSPSTLTEFMSGNHDNITIGTLYRVTKVLGISLNEIISGMPVFSGRIPVYGSIRGEDTEKKEPKEYIEAMDNNENLIAFRVKGNAMNSIAPDGSFIVVDQAQKEPLSLIGKVVAIDFLGQVIFRILKVSPTRFEPASTDPGYDTIFPQPGQDWHIIGKAKRVINDID